MEKKILLYFGSEHTKEIPVTRVLHDLEIPFRVLSAQDTRYTTGYLMGLTSNDARKENVDVFPKQDLMILYNIKDAEINAMNTLFTAMSVEMKRKAMLTDHNRNWYVYDLLDKIEKEHRYFEQMESIRTILSQSSTLIIEDYTPSSWKVYEDAFYQAYTLITKQQATPTKVDHIYQQLVQARNQLQKRQIE